MEKVTRVDLSKFCKTETEIIDSVIWMIKNQGPLDHTRRFRDLRYLEFENEREATFFILKWS